VPPHKPLTPHTPRTIPVSSVSEGTGESAHLRSGLPYLSAQVERGATVVQRSGAVAQEHAGHRRAACRDRARTCQNGEHLLHVTFGGGDAAAAQRPVRRHRCRWSAGQVKDVLPALSEFSAPGWRDDLPGAQGQCRAGPWRASRRELAIQGWCPQPDQQAIPGPVVVRGGPKQQVCGHIPSVHLDTGSGKWQD
jgi:hypothetical protein